MDKRREAEAAEAMESSSTKKKAKKKKATRKKATRKRTKVAANVRKRLVWGVFNGNMKEEGRFPYHERAAAEDKLEKLQTKSPKKMFFIQPIKEEITDAPAAEEEDE